MQIGSWAWHAAAALGSLVDLERGRALGAAASAEEGWRFRLVGLSQLAMKLHGPCPAAADKLLFYLGHAQTL